MSDPDWNRMKEVVLQFLRTKYGRLPESQRMLPYIMFTDPDTMELIPISPNDAIREVSNLSELGRKIIVAEINKVGREIGRAHV